MFVYPLPYLLLPSSTGTIQSIHHEAKKETQLRLTGVVVGSANGLL